MIPERIPEWARIEDPTPAPQTPAEQDETVNADILRRALHVRVDALISRVRALPVESPTSFQYVPGLIREASSDIQAAIERYLDVERTFHKSRT
jgi:hypothetical protein